MPDWLDVVDRAVTEVGLELVHAELLGRGRGRVLRVYIDQPGGVGLDDCERASHAVGAALDRNDEVIAGGYTLEVSSPGLERPLFKPADFDRFAGQRVRVRTRNPIGGSRNFVGVLLGGGAAGARLQPESGVEALIAWDNLEKAHLAPLWPAASKPKRGRN